MPDLRTDRRRTAAAERRVKALKLRAAGATLDDIMAAVPGYKTRAAVSQDISRALATMATESADEMRALSNERLDLLWRTALQILGRTHYVVSNGRLVTHDGQPMRDDDPALRAIGVLLNIEQRRARLNGLDAPKQVEVITVDAVEAEIRRLSAELGATEAGEVAGVEATTG
jgi:hypothetical protein